MSLFLWSQHCVNQAFIQRIALMSQNICKPSIHREEISSILGFHHVDLSVSQLFRKDLISAMKLPDNEPLEAEDYWTVTDTWKQEWERGVQVKTRYNLYIER